MLSKPFMMQILANLIASMIALAIAFFLWTKGKQE